MKNYYFLLSVLFLCCNSNFAIAQTTEPEDIVAKTDDFENSFFEAIKQKGMENFDKAINELEKCANLQPKNALVYFELGKNYYNQKNYKNAYENYEKATQLDPSNRWFWAGLYDVSYDTKNYNQAIPIVEKLITFKEDYKNDMISLFMNTQQFDKALLLINEVNDKFGKDDKRDFYKAQILRDSKLQVPEKNNLLDQIAKNPKEESNYLSLIFLYSESNQEEKALEIAKKLEKEIPTSDMVQVSMFKFHLNKNNGENAVKSMNTVLSSAKIDKKIKHRILNEFLLFVKTNPKFEPDLDTAIGYFENDKEVNVTKEIGKFYQNKKEWIKASKYYEMHLKSMPDDMETILLLGQTYIESKQFEKLNAFSEQLLQLYPTQPQLYYYLGLALNQFKKHKKAKEALESGLDFVIEDLPLQINFNIQLGEAYSGLGDLKNKEISFNKANELLKKVKK